MERLLIFLVRLLLKFLRLNRTSFVESLGEIYKTDFLSLAYRQRGILKYKDAESGERFLIQKVLTVALPEVRVIFDVGANVGNYCLDVHESFPGAKIWCFEPNPNVACILRTRVKDFASVVQAAVGQETSHVTLYNTDSSERSEHGSLYGEALRGVHGYSVLNGVNVQQVSLDRFVLDEGISIVDFLKIDTEGHEYAVLQGCCELIKNSRIRIIQFEFNELNLFSRVYLRDFFLILSEYDFYRLDTNTLHPIEYSPKEEIFQYQNILCVQKKDPVAVYFKSRFENDQDNDGS